MIAWLSRKFSRDPGQLGLFETDVPAPDARGAHLRLLPPEDGPAEPAARAADVSPAPAVHQTTPDPEAMLATLRGAGLRGVDRVIFTRNRRTMVSLAGGVLRLHEGFSTAPASVLTAIATFATSRNRVRRSEARQVIVSYPVPMLRARRRPPVQHPDDLPMATRLTAIHAELNLIHFDGALASVEVQVSRRLARRLGHYTLRADTGSVGEIVISRRHVRRDGWPEATHTLLHEMVHQWQDETGRPVDHGPGFRAKCREVGIRPAASRMIER